MTRKPFNVRLRAPVKKLIREVKTPDGAEILCFVAELESGAIRFRYLSYFVTSEGEHFKNSANTCHELSDDDFVYLCSRMVGLP